MSIRLRFLLALSCLVIVSGWIVPATPLEAADPDIQVKINEILASNRTGLRDPERQYDDWIELYNAGPDAVDLAGLYLTDNPSAPTKWQFPTDDPALTTVAPQGFLLVWADGDISDAGLHAAFKLSAKGEEVALFAADGTTLIDSLSFPEQIADISYGRYPDGDLNVEFMVFPTPTAANIHVYDGIAERPTMSPGSCLCSDPISVTLTTGTEETIIYYSLDGSDPYSTDRGRPSGSVYTEPIQITRTTTIKAAAWRPGWQASPIGTQRYTFVEPSLRDFSSPLPIAVVDTVDPGTVTRTVKPAYGYVIDTAADGQASMANGIDFAGRAAINVRGKSSEGFAKKQYHFETLDEEDKDKSVSILGFPPESDWVLQGPYSDKTLIRNLLVYRWSNEIGRYAPRARLIELFINTDTSMVSMSDYMGVYVFMEKIKIAPERVDITLLEPSDNAEPEVTGGYIIKKDKFDGDDRTFNTSRGQRLIYYNPNKDDLTDPQADWIRNYVNAFEAALYGTNYKDPLNGYAGFIDVGSFIDSHILVELAKNIDGFRLSTYMFKDRGGKLNMGPTWDYNLSLGNANYLDGWIPTGWYNRLLGDGDYPWWRRLFQDPAFQIAYADRWFALRRNLFTTDRLLGMVEDYATLLAEPQARNFQRWHILGQSLWPNWFVGKTHREEIDWMKNWLATRLEWMDSTIASEYAAAPPAFSQQGGRIDPGFSLTMTAPTGTIYYTLDGSDPRFTTGTGTTLRTVTLVDEAAPKRVLVPTEEVAVAWRGSRTYDDSDWIDGAGGVGYENTSGYEQLFDVDVRNEMNGINTSCYLRIPFEVAAEHLSHISTLALSVRYDDGFIAYLNGVEIQRAQFAGTPAWDSSADGIHSDTDAVEFETFNVSNYIGQLRPEQNILAIHGLNASTSSSDFLISADLTGGITTEGASPSTVQEYDGPMTLNSSVAIKARAFANMRWSALNEAVFAVGPVAETLRISEIMYHPADAGHPDDPNTEYIELTNIGTETINLNRAAFTNGVQFTFSDIELAPGGYALVVKDAAAFATRYGPDMPVVGQYTGSLNNAGERITLQDAAGQIIHDFSFQDGWYDITDRLGFSLTVKDPAGTDPNALGNKAAWRPSADSDGSPGFDDAGMVPELGTVVINELLPSPEPGAPEWIELHNVTDQTISIGGWFLSDDADDLTKYMIAAGTTIGPGAYVVFYEDQHFGTEDDNGSRVRFGLSRDGETVYLHSGAGGFVTGYSEAESFGSSESGVSFGRYLKSTGTYNFVAMSEPTPGWDNADPQVGPVVISEIMYHPNGPAEAEYVKLLNISDAPVTLYDAARGTPWRFSDDPANPEIAFLFPEDTPVTLAPDEYLVLVQNVAAFRATYYVPDAAQVLAWGAGQLSNGGEKIQLSKPGRAEADGTRNWIRVDRVVYSDGSHPDVFTGLDPWPIEADGQGPALSRIDPAAYGNDPANWQTVQPTPPDPRRL